MLMRLRGRNLLLKFTGVQQIIGTKPLQPPTVESLLPVPQLFCQEKAILNWTKISKNFPATN
jgi:hypothetical protein